ncbi:MAG: choice-of-anchor J domain-containing protein [Bacteroidetes bacterium]|nr:choice-of-anchor J domain-containing protein [Bacteroidota bacterium]
MKKQLLSIAIAAGVYANAQTVLWSENFNGTTPPALPSTWKQNNVDGFTPSSSLSAWNFGTNAWVTRDVTSGYPAYGKSAASTSWFTAANTANRWIITPQFTVTSGTYLSWEAIALDPSYPDGYQVLVSTTGTNVASFTNTLLTISGENANWTTRSLSLGAFAGQNIYVAFRNNSTDMYILMIDNVSAVIPAANDGAVTSVTSVPRYMAPGNVTISGVYKNNGASATNNALMRYRVDNGAVVTETINFSSGGVNYFQNAGYSFATNAALAAGPHTIKVWVDATNGTSESNHLNDTSSTVVFVATQARTRNALIEEFSSSTCNPCASLNSTFDPLLATNNPNSNGQVNVIKYQMNWPSPGTDPSYNAFGNTRRGFYGVTGIPDAYTNGKTNMVSHNQAEIDAAKAEPAWADMTATISVAGSNISASSTITPFITVPAGKSSLKVFQVLAQEFYNFPGAVTTQKNYYHIMRTMNPNGNGSAASVTVAVPQSFSFNHTSTVVATPVQMSNSFWTVAGGFNYEYVMFVQDTISGDILNSVSAKTSVVTGLVKLNNDSKIGVYPNPAKDYATLAIKLTNESKVSIAIYDVTGKIVYTKAEEMLVAGQNEININTENFVTGTYNIVVSTSNGTLKEKLIVVK